VQHARGLSARRTSCGWTSEAARPSDDLQTEIKLT